MVIPGSFNSDHIDSNFDLDGWSLTDNDLMCLANCEKRLRVYSDIQRMRLPSRVFFDDEVNKTIPIMLSSCTDSGLTSNAHIGLRLTFGMPHDSYSRTGPRMNTWSCDAF